MLPNKSQTSEKDNVLQTHSTKPLWGRLSTSIYLGTVLRGVKLPRFIERQNRQIDVG